MNRIGAGRLYQVANILGVPVSYFYEDVIDRQHEHPRANEHASPPVMEFLSSGEGLQLALAFMRIKESKVRKRVIDLVKTLADGEGELD